MRISAATTTFLTALTATTLFKTSSGHDCDNENYLPKAAELASIFQLQKLDDGSYGRPLHRSSIQVIPDGNSNLTYTAAASTSMFLLTDEVNEYGWCWDGCAAYAEDGDPSERYEPCWEVCKEMNPVTYGFSYFHRLTRDETWYFYFGDTIYLYELDNNENGDMRVIQLGTDIASGQVLSHTVAAGTWFAAQVNPDSESHDPYALGATVIAPAFEEGDYELADVTYEYTYMEFKYSNAASKIQELSFHPDYIPVEDDPYADEGVHSLCRHNGEELLDVELMTLEYVIDHFGMEEYSKGGYYSEDYRASDNVITTYGGTRSAVSSLYYAMNDTVFFHRQHSDETYHFHYGEPIILYEIDDSSHPAILRAISIGSDVTIGEIPHYTVKNDTWVALEFRNNNYTFWNAANVTPYALFGITNGPGYDEGDFEFGVPASMVNNFPQFASTIKSLYLTGSAQNLNETEEVGIGDIFTSGGECNNTDLNMTTYNSTDYNLTDYNSTGNETGCFNWTADFGLAQPNAQNSEASDRKGGMIALYVLLGMVCAALLAFVVIRQRNEKEDEFFGHDGITVVCERGGHVQTLETISVAGKSRRSVSYIDFSGMIHQS